MNKKSKLFVNARIYTPDRVIEKGQVFVREGKIERIVDHSLKNAEDGVEVVDVQEQLLVPGFVDVHVHGGGGYDVMSGRVQDIEGLSRFHAQKGTTSLLPTTLTADLDSTERAIRSIVEAKEKGTGGADVLGIHLEGPFINEKRCGAQNPAYIRPPSMKELDHFLDVAKNQVRLLTMAPEGSGALEMIRRAVERGVTVSIGHSDATYVQVQQAVEAGASHVTHLFNGMRALHHREPGVAGAAMMLPELAVELICDGFHVHPELIDFIFQIKATDKVVMITDAMSAAGLPDGDHYELGGLACYMKAGQVRLKSSDDLAGSCLTMDQALRHVREYTGKSVEEILPAMTLNPARQIGYAEQKGSIERGKDADLVILSHQYEVQATYVRGECVYNGSKE